MHLIPEVREDKNGRMTTRWVNPAWAKAADSKKPIPKVNDAGHMARVELLGYLNSRDRLPRQDLGQAIERTVTGQEAERLVAFLKIPRDKSATNELLRTVMVNIENPKLGKCLNERLIAHYDNAVAEGILGVQDLLTGIGEMNRDLTVEQEWALLKVTQAASRFDAVQRINVPFPFDAYALVNEEFIDLVVANHDKADEIGAIAAERKTDDAKTIAGLLGSSSHSSLKQGDL